MLKLKDNEIQTCREEIQVLRMERDSQADLLKEAIEKEIALKIEMSEINDKMKNM